MVEPAPGAGAFQRPQIAHLLDDADQRPVAPRIEAERTRIGRIDIAALRTHPDLVARLGHGRSEWAKQPVAVLDQMKGGAAGRAGSEARQLGEKLDQPLDFRPRGVGHQNGSFSPGGSGSPPVTDFISSAITCSTLVLASA